VALVTGAGRGVGRALALALADAGATVALVSRSSRELDSTAAEIGRRGGSAMALTADLGDRHQIKSLAAAVLAELGAVTVLVNNAAQVEPLGPTTNVDIDDWSAALAVNVVGPAALTLELLPAMLANHWGRIVNISSGIVARPTGFGFNAYAASKAALEAHTVNLAAELAGTGVTINCFRPGSVDTAMNAWVCRQPPEKIGAAAKARYNELRTSGLLASPASVASALLEHMRSEDSGQIWALAGA
jgi:NAD(P)-dependent dehydrogenase (short-subunit alcohol dehydrogenase family)